MKVFCCVENGVPEVLKQVDDVQLKIDQMNEHASDEILAVERRYVKLRLPLYEVSVSQRRLSFFFACYHGHISFMK